MRLFLTGSVAVALACAGQLSGCRMARTNDAPAIAAAQGTVAATGKESMGIADLPPGVLQAALAARPGLQITAVEHEQRNGSDYYDVAGRLGTAEVELDITRKQGRWTVVEVQRDIGADELPAPVALALAKANPGFRTRRIIESDQGDGLVIYECFGSRDGHEEVKVEVKFDGASASVLTSEWAH